MLHNLGASRTSASLGGILLLTAITIVAGGCQTFSAAPLNLRSFQADLDTRPLAPEPVEAFAARLRESDATIPDRIDFADGLTAAEAEVVALFYNPDLRLARLHAGVALATYENAGLWEDPVFGFDGAEILSPAAPFEFGFSLQFTLPVSGRLGIERDLAGAEHAAQLRRVADAEWHTRTEVRRRWTRWATAALQLDLHNEVLAQLERIITLTDQLEAAGELRRVDARLFRAELAAQRAAHTDAERQTRQARLDLLAITGLPPAAAINLVPGLPTLPPESDPASATRMIETNTLLAVRRAEYQAAEHALRLEVRKQYPDITIGTGYANEDDDRLLLGLSLPVPSLNANRAGIAEALAARALARGSAETTYEQLLHQLQSARAALDAVRSQQAAYESTLVPMLTAQSADVEHLASLGDVDTLLLLDTVTRQADAKSRLLDLREDERQIEITIAQLLGPDTPAQDTDATQTAIQSATGDTP
ncbi:MAG: TolC family protein [Phycisphaerales bacterium JB054]